MLRWVIFGWDVISSVVVVNVFFSSFFFFKQKTAYEMRISDWSSDVCSSDLPVMVVIPYDNVQRLCVSLREMEKPLGLYVFSKRSRFVQDVLDGSFSGGVTVNDAMFHYSVPDLPFGGEIGRAHV